MPVCRSERACDATRSTVCTHSRETARDRFDFFIFQVCLKDGRYRPSLSRLPRLWIVFPSLVRIVEGFDAKFAASYANAFTPPGLSYNWSLGASWECGFFGAGYFLLAYASILLLPPATGTPKAKSKTA